MLEVYHLGRSQSERVVWLCEELKIPYQLHIHERNPETALAPPIFKELHTPGTAPVIIDTTEDGHRIVLGESGACVEYIINVYGGGRFQVKPGAANYADYLSWWHFANGSFQPANLRQSVMALALGGRPAEGPILKRMQEQTQTFLNMIDKRLGEVPYFAGDELSAADIMIVYSLTTNRGFRPVDFTDHKNILTYLQRIVQRDGYRRAREKGDPNTPPLVDAQVERFKFGPLR